MKEQGAKERILQTASELFYQQGYQATGINQIIEEAGVPSALPASVQHSIPAPFYQVACF